MKEEFKTEELRQTATEIKEAVRSKSVTADMVGGTLLGLVNATGEVLDTLGHIPKEHVRVRVNTLDTAGRSEHSTEATVYVEIFNTKGYPAVNLPRQELHVDENGNAEFDVPHGFQFAVWATHPGLSASFQWVHTAAVEERPIIVLWCVPIGVWWMGALFHSNEEDRDWGDELYRPVPYLFDHFTRDWDEIGTRAEVDLREGENFMDYYNYGILVATADTCFVIPPYSLSETNMAWCGNRAYGMYIPGMEHINNHTEAGKWTGDYSEAQVRARSDMNGNMNTAKILGAVDDATAAEWCGAIVYDFSENRWLPSAGQMYLIWLNRTVINNLMKEAIDDGWTYHLLPYQNANGTWICPNKTPEGNTRSEYWWTSTIYDDFCSWVVDYNGNVLNNLSVNSYDVRAVSAFHFEY